MIVLLVAGLLAAGTVARAQERVWNAALDRYDYISRRCTQWRERIERGESVPRDSLQALTRELSEVRKNLQYALGDMTLGQRRRFEAIRDWFTSGQWTAPEAERIDAMPCSPSLSSGTTAELSFPRREEITKKSPSDTARIKVRSLAGLAVAVYPDVSYGLVGGIVIDRWRFFLKARSSFSMKTPSYDCLSDGTTAGGYFWSGGAKTVGRHQITFDAAYAFASPASIYLGAGYGVRTLCWQDIEGKWARVTDRCFKGVAIDGGILVHPIPKGPVQGLTFLFGGSYLPKNYFDLELGLLWCF